MKHEDGLQVRLENCAALRFAEYSTPTNELTQQDRQPGGAVCSCTLFVMRGIQFQVAILIDEEFEPHGADGLLITITTGPSKAQCQQSCTYWLDFTCNALGSELLVTHRKHSFQGPKTKDPLELPGSQYEPPTTNAPATSGTIAQRRNTASYHPGPGCVIVTVQRAKRRDESDTVGEREFPTFPAELLDQCRNTPVTVNSAWLEPLETVHGWPYVFQFRNKGFHQDDRAAMYVLHGFEGRELGFRGINEAMNRSIPPAPKRRVRQLSPQQSTTTPVRGAGQSRISQRKRESLTPPTDEERWSEASYSPRAPSPPLATKRHRPSHGPDDRQDISMMDGDPDDEEAPIAAKQESVAPFTNQRQQVSSECQIDPDDEEIPQPAAKEEPTEEEFLVIRTRSPIPQKDKSGEKMPCTPPQIERELEMYTNPPSSTSDDQLPTIVTTSDAPDTPYGDDHNEMDEKKAGGGFESLSEWEDELRAIELRRKIRAARAERAGGMP